VADLGGDGVDGGEVGGSAFAHGGGDAEEEDLDGFFVAAGDGCGGADAELEPAGGGAFGDEVGEAGFEDADLASLEAFDLGDVDVGADDAVAEVGEAGGGGEADVPGPDDGDAACEHGGLLAVARGRPVGLPLSTRWSAGGADAR